MTLPPGGLPSLGGWAVGFGVVVIVALWLSRGDGARRRAWGWTLVATAFPGAWATAWKVAPLIPGDLPPGAGSLAVALVGYAALLWTTGVLVAAGEGAWAPPEPVRPASKAAPRAAPKATATPKPKPAPKSSLPTVRPVGAVAAGAARGGGSAPEVERDGLLRVLSLGPDFQTSAAAKGLAVAWAGTRDAATMDGLIDVLRREDVSRAARAEVWIALVTVDDAAPPWDDQVEVRRTFPDGVDWDRVDALDAEIHPS